MKQPFALTAAWLLAATLNLHAQGSLTPPPGAPAPVMKSLDQVEARTPLVAGQSGVSISAAGTITITQSGSYYLTKNVTITTNANGIEINADATVDLNGFSIIGSAADITTGKAVTITTGANANVKNGFIKGGTSMPTSNTYAPAGFQFGVFGGSPPSGVRSSVILSELQVSGVRVSGIYLRRLSLVERCTVQGVGGNGIDVAPWGRPDSPSFDPRYESLVRDSHASDCGGQYGIGANRVTFCFGHTTASGGDYTYAICGILSQFVDNSTGWATGIETTPWDNYGLFGVHASSASFCNGRNTGNGNEGRAIRADIAIGCTSRGGVITASQKHLGTP